MFVPQLAARYSVMSPQAFGLLSNSQYPRFDSVSADAPIHSKMKMLQRFPHPAGELHTDFRRVTLQR
jgi:hypothetical protein